MGQNENALLREAINDNEDGGVSAGEGKVFNEIHGDGVPRLLWHRELSEESIGVMSWSLSTSTSSTGTHILLDKGAELWPSVFTLA